MKDVQGREVTPNLTYFIRNNASLYADKISSQARYGNSGDGQMLMITGLLPISYGSAAMYFGNNVYPSWAHLYEHSMVINPSPLAWNIDVTTPSYGFKQLVQPDDSRVFWDDAQVTTHLMNVVDTIKEPFAIFAITETMHGPYLKIPYNPQIMEFPNDMPTHMRNYLTCVHYTDSCIGAFLNFYMRSHPDKLDNTIILITGDHTTFKPGGVLRDFIPYAKKNNMPMAEGITYCPLIVYDKSRSKILRSDMCYQMDIYPTIMSCIGAKDYPWKGFGIDLYTTLDTIKRPFLEERAYELSNKIIRSNYFDKLSD